MSRKYEKKTVPAAERTYTDLVKVTCDICGAENEDKNWAKGAYDFNAVKIRRIKGSNYGSDGGDSEEEFFDICPKCWDDKIKPALALMGAEPSKKERTW
jgi:hypothetical protein